MHILETPKIYLCWATTVGHFHLLGSLVPHVDVHGLALALGIIGTLVKEMMSSLPLLTYIKFIF